MSDIPECLKYARFCERQAESIQNPASREILLWVAAQFRKLAKVVAKYDAADKDPKPN